MRYSLLSRFQGALLGAAIGARLGAAGQLRQRRQKQTPLTDSPASGNRILLPQGDLNPPQPDPENSAVALTSRAGKIAAWYAERLIQLGGRKALIEPAAAPFPLLPEQLQGQLKHQVTGVELAIATLPIALFCHEDEAKLRQMLQQAADLQGLADLQDGAIAVGFAIARALKEQLHADRLIPGIIAYLQQESQPSDYRLDLIRQLEQGQILLQERTPLHPAFSTLLPANSSQTGAGAIALALFCFLHTPEETELAMLHAARSPNSPQSVCALTGALAGAYNSIAGFPLQGSLMASDATQILDWGLSGLGICQLATRLLAAWSGAYDPTLAVTNAVAIAAPGMIRPR